MKLKRILIEDFKQFAGQVLIDELSPGLNIFTGPNESGKTSIATAVRTVFLEKHRSSTLKHLVPWQASSGQPRIEVEFTTGEQHYLLRKSFVTKARCELIHDGRHRLEGEEAEEALAALLRFSRPGRGSASPEHGGIPGLLWVTQGQAQDVDGPVTHAAIYLREALNQLSGAKIESGEDVLIAAVNRELHSLVTEKIRKPTGELAAVEAELAQAREQAQQLRRQQGQFEEDVDRLASLQAEYDQVARQKPWEALEKKAADARSKVEELRIAKRALDQLESLQNAGREKIRLLRERELDANRDLEAFATLEAEHAKARKAADEAAGELDQQLRTMGDFAAAVEQARQQLQLAQTAEQAKDLQAKAQWQQEELDRLGHSLREAQAIRVQIKSVQTEAGKTRIDEAKLRRLRALETELSSLQAKMDAAGTRIEYRLADGKALRLDDAILQGSGHKLLEGKAVLQIPGVGEVTIIPGASNLSSLSAQHGERKAEQAALFLALRVSTLADAEGRFLAHQGLERELDSLNRQLQFHAPKGIDALESARDAARAGLQQTQDVLAAMPDVAHALPLQEAKERLAQATARHAACEQRHRELIGMRSSLEARTSSLFEQLEAKRRLLGATDWQARRRQDQDELADALATAGMRASEIEAAKRRLEELATEVDEGDAERFARSARLQREAHDRQKGELIALGARLEQVGASGLGERLAEAEAALEQLGRRQQELALRADALALLADLLVEERDRMVQRLQAPLLSRLEHYCRKLFPQAGLSLDDKLSPAGFRRNGWEAQLGQLSFGTQEQLGILCRLAYADLLREAQVPTLLLLDDAVVHTDAARRDRIKRALLDAQERHQILVFTCHPEAWNDLGVVPRSIQSMRVAA
ncbi:AAA family ATPase [Noviherbaspirillum massiliense]|uniref:AAA family ATPase n=1 Tax=Noviherbaspirillum massiliense TaxID=1465823 RepID=UPI00031E7FAC|nr:hypothetical protein [Noviherbaspirillum massiliense]